MVPADCTQLQLLPPLLLQVLLCWATHRLPHTLSMFCRATSGPCSCASDRKAQILSSVSFGLTATSSLLRHNNPQR